MRRSEELSGELVRGTHIHVIFHADFVHDFVTERANRSVWFLCFVGGWGAIDLVRTEIPAIQFPFFAATIEKLNVFVTVKFEVPVCVCGEPVVVAAIEDYLVVVSDSLS